jgi:hypothetical protein
LSTFVDVENKLRDKNFTIFDPCCAKDDCRGKKCRQYKKLLYEQGEIKEKNVSISSKSAKDTVKLINEILDKIKLRDDVEFLVRKAHLMHDTLLSLSLRYKCNSERLSALCTNKDCGGRLRFKYGCASGQGYKCRYALPNYENVYLKLSLDSTECLGYLTFTP